MNKTLYTVNSPDRLPCLMKGKASLECLKYYYNKSKISHHDHLGEHFAARQEKENCMGVIYNNFNEDGELCRVICENKKTLLHTSMPSISSCFVPSLASS